MAKEPADVIEVGRLFHKRGPATAKDRFPAAVFDRGTNRLICTLVTDDDVDSVRFNLARMTTPWHRPIYSVQQHLVWLIIFSVFELNIFTI